MAGDKDEGEGIPREWGTRPKEVLIKSDEVPCPLSVITVAKQQAAARPGEVAGLQLELEGRKMNKPPEEMK